MRLMNNMVQLAGALAADPELRRLSDGSFITHFRLRTFRSPQDQSVSNNSQLYFNLKAIGHTAQEIERNFRKNSQILIRGELRNRLIIKDGQRFYRTEVQVYEFLALGKLQPSQTHIPEGSSPIGLS